MYDNGPGNRLFRTCAARPTSDGGSHISLQLASKNGRPGGSAGGERADCVHGGDELGLELEGGSPRLWYPQSSMHGEGCDDEFAFGAPLAPRIPSDRLRRADAKQDGKPFTGRHYVPR